MATLSALFVHWPSSEADRPLRSHFATIFGSISDQLAVQWNSISILRNAINHFDGTTVAASFVEAMIFYPEFSGISSVAHFVIAADIAASNRGGGGGRTGPVLGINGLPIANWFGWTDCFGSVENYSPVSKLLADHRETVNVSCPIDIDSLPVLGHTAEQPTIAARTAFQFEGLLTPNATNWTSITTRIWISPLDKGNHPLVVHFTAPFIIVVLNCRVNGHSTAIGQSAGNHLGAPGAVWMDRATHNEGIALQPFITVSICHTIVSTA